ncbi:hypothetical protein RRG08_055211 [Elysia crispata]|uniref:Mitochondrial splicing suppressor 51-like C-terminal domain-containing protein n=1 Tax=Elysia crispata TaxID=231223 RepID=A0AAE1CLR2_9GAST|nr:hypothetical protein RRG08_055211 [Elysia crispata]
MFRVSKHNGFQKPFQLRLSVRDEIISRRKSHRVDCNLAMSTMRSIIDDSLPFTFYDATSSEKFDGKALKAFLQERDLYNKGLWRHLCSKTKSKGLKFGAMCKDSQLFVLCRETAILQSAPSSPLSLDLPLEHWLDYYRYRGFELDSPIAGILHYPLTLYWIVTNRLGKLYPALFDRVKQSGKIQVHIIGAEIEADMFQAFVECGHLLSPIKLEMHLFGNEISKEVDGKKSESLQNVSFILHSCLYHEFQLDQLPFPEVIIGFNAGLSAYPSFKKTIQKITEKDTAFFCTDFCLESVMHTKEVLQDFNLGRVTETICNPFHSPFRIPAPELEHSCFSNAFVFAVQSNK